MAFVNPGDRDRGLRLVDAVTSAVAAVSPVAIGGTTALAAGGTRHADRSPALSAAMPNPRPKTTGSVSSAA
jgi:hypothetical protein